MHSDANEIFNSETNECQVCETNQFLNADGKCENYACKCKRGLPSTEGPPLFKPFDAFAIKT